MLHERNSNEGTQKNDSIGNWAENDCIDCRACPSECPVEAIFPEWEVPEEWQGFISLNAEMAAKCPPILEKKAPLVSGGE